MLRSWAIRIFRALLYFIPSLFLRRISERDIVWIIMDTQTKSDAASTCDQESLLSKNDSELKAEQAQLRTADKDLFQAVSEGSEKSALKLLQEPNKKFSQKVLDDSLLEMCRQGNRILVEELVSFGANIHTVTEDGWTPLLVAADCGNIDVLRVLLQKGADVSAVNADGDTALILSIRPVQALQYMYIKQMFEEGEIDMDDENSRRYCEDSPPAVEMVKMLIEKGVNINQKNFTGLSPLMAAAQIKERSNVFKILMAAVQIKKSLSVLEILLLNGASMNAKDDRGNTALMHAIQSDCTENADFLIKQQGHQKVDFELQNTSGSNALISAIKHNNTAIIDLLLVCGANVNVEDNSGDTALTWAARKGDVDTVKKIIERGGNINHQNKEGYSALMFSAAQKRSDILRTLLHYGAEINAKDNMGNTALMHAVNHRCTGTENAKILIDQQGEEKIDFNNALISAVKHRNKVITNLLLACGAKVSLQDESGDTALTWAARNSIMITLKEVVGKGADLNHQNKEGHSALMLAAQNGSVHMLKFLLHDGANVNAKDVMGNTALLLAVEHGCTETAKLLIEYEGDQKVDFEVQNNLGSNALISAAKHSNILITYLLISRGVNVNVRDNDKETAMTWAARNNERNTLKKLIERGADVNHQNKEGYSALMLAARKPNYAFMKTLLKAGANINAVSHGPEKKTAVSLLHDLPSRTCSVFSFTHVLLDRGASSSSMPPKAMFDFIRYSEMKLVPKLISSGFGPFKLSPPSYLLFETERLAIPQITPFFFALLNDCNIASYFSDIWFFSTTDIQLQSKHHICKQVIERRSSKRCVDIFDEFCSQPMSLFKLSFVTVSSAIGHFYGREDRVMQLPIPLLFKDMLLFKSQEVSMDSYPLLFERS